LSRSIRDQLSPIDELSFRKACGKFATGVAVATVRTQSNDPVGITVNSFTSVSASPPLVLVCIDYRSSILTHFRATSFFGINVLTGDQQDLSARFSQRELDRFDGIAWHSGSTGVPLLEGAMAALECCVEQTVEAGDHAVFIASVVRAEWRDDPSPLLFFAGSYYRL
jgi:flavin reductase (DIM6/NTAB) family NADH-FMN oxidoreductase RutF